MPVILWTIAASSISSSGSRLVLGERDAVMQEALKNGGKYILVHPEVANQLKKGQVDLYLIYEKALILEMESKISQIDFVNVDEAIQEWQTAGSGANVCQAIVVAKRKR